MNSDMLIKQIVRSPGSARIFTRIIQRLTQVIMLFFCTASIMEVEHQELVRKNRNLKYAGFDVIKTFDGYEFKDIQITNTINIE